MLKKLRFVAVVAASVVAITATGLSSTSGAYASTVYDTAYTSIDTLTVSQDHFYNSLTCDPVDLTYTWQNYILDPAAQLVSGSPFTADYATLRASFAAAYETGSYAVSVNYDTSPTAGQYMQTAVVYWTEDGDAALNWTSYASGTRYGVDFTSSGGEIHFAQIGNKAAVVGSGGCQVGWGYPDTTNYSNLSSFYNYLSTSTWVSPPSGSYHASANLLVVNTDTNLPTGYEGVGVSSEAPGAEYVAMGDSFSSGEGNEPFVYGTDINGVNECHRSADAYPLSVASTMSFDSVIFVACSGATTNDVIGLSESDNPEGRWNAPAQLDALSNDTSVVTITIGGNDVGFPSYAYACISNDCDSSTAAYADIMEEIDLNLHTKLLDVYAEILNGAENAEIYVLGYPYIPPTTDLDSLPTQCSYFNSIGLGAGEDAEAAVEVIDELNSAISWAVYSANSLNLTTRLTFIDPNNSTSGSFGGHDVCQASGFYFYNVTPTNALTNQDQIFHPNQEGHNEYAAIVVGAL